MQVEGSKTPITAVGSGLAVRDGRGYSASQRPTAFSTPDGWRAEISGVENGCVVRSWAGATYATRAQALAAAQAQAEG